MKKIIAFVVILVIVIGSFTGCMYGEDRLVINKDGSGQLSTKIVVNKAVFDELTETLGFALGDMGLADATVETIDGIESYVLEETTEFSSFSELKKGLADSGFEEVSVSSKGIHFIFPEQASEGEIKAFEEEFGYDLEEMLKASIIITMPKNIVKTTGKLSEDKNTASFDFLLDDFYKDQVILVSVEKDSTKPTLKGFTNKKTYNKAITVSASDTSGIKSAKYKKNSGKYYSFKKERTFKTNGSYTVYAIDNFGNKTTKTFKIKDTARPTVSGVTTDKTYKSKRTITFKDNCGIEKATLNGKTVKSGVSVSKKGSYKLIVTDVNGLKRTVNFRIK